MAVNVETLDKLERKMTLTLPVDVIKSEVDSRLKRLARTVRMDGFRPGKVPMTVVAQRYGYSVHYEVMNDKVGEAFAVAANEATFAFSEVRIGVVPAVISVTVLPRLLPRQAHELFLTGEAFDAQRAKDIGLLNSAVPVDGVDAEVRRYTDMLALGAPNALAATKQMLQQERSSNLGKVFADMLELSAQHFGGPEGQEGITAFKEKRKPSWVPAD